LLESLMVLMVLAAMVAAGLAVLTISAGLLLSAGFICAALGVLFGVPAGLWYHLRLREALLHRPPLPDKWWLHPTRYRPDLEPSERKRVFPWFYLGAAGFMVSMLGALLAMLGVLRFV